MITFFIHSIIVRFGRRLKIFVNVFAKKPKYAPNRLTYTIPGVPLFEDNYEVLSTDYKTYTIEYSCRNKPPFGHISKYSKIYL